MIEALVIGLIAVYTHIVSTSLVAGTIAIALPAIPLVLILLSLHVQSHFPPTVIVASGIIGLLTGFSLTPITTIRSDSISDLVSATGHFVGFSLLAVCCIIFFSGLIEFSIRLIFSTNRNAASLINYIPFKVLRFWLFISAATILSPVLIGALTHV